MLEKLLTDYRPFDALEMAIHRQLLQFLSASPNAYDRSNLTAHVIADAWIVNPARTHVVLHHQVANDLWTTPGGHCDGSNDVLTAARREAEEESGLSNLKVLLEGRIFDLNSGNIALKMKPHGLEPAHIHFDVCFAFEAPENAPLLISEESHTLRWVPVNEAYDLVLPEHQRRVEKTRHGLI